MVSWGQAALDNARNAQLTLAKEVGEEKASRFAELVIGRLQALVGGTGRGGQHVMAQMSSIIRSTDSRYLIVQDRWVVESKSAATCTLDGVLDENAAEKEI